MGSADRAVGFFLAGGALYLLVRILQALQALQAAGGAIQ